MATRIEPRLTVADLDACPDDNNRYELIEGELFVSRAPGIPHQRVLHNLQMELGSYLRENPLGILVPGAGAVFSDYDAVIPDLVFVRSDRWAEVTSEQKITNAPDIVVEILSPGSENRRRDLSVKRQLYAKYGVKEYWIVDSESLSVRIFHLQGETLEEIAVLRGIDEITSPLLAGFCLKADAVFDLK
ncbi:MAG: Uma2 family endonuclease [Pyrinomonadaceae bacterium]|nr:Uma2 family endonuclease [Pyrinomonadaceae bacterium]